MSKRTGKPGAPDFNLRVAWLRYTKAGNMTSAVITKEMYDAVQQIEEGGRFFIKIMTDKEGKEFGVLEYMSKEKVAEFDSSVNQPSNGNSRQAEDSL